MHLGHCAEMAVEIERGFSGNPLKSKFISETAAAHSIRSESEIEDFAIHMHTRVLFPGR